MLQHNNSSSGGSVFFFFVIFALPPPGAIPSIYIYIFNHQKQQNDSSIGPFSLGR
jgi:hypothetical protein